MMGHCFNPGALDETFARNSSGYAQLALLNSR